MNIEIKNGVKEYLKKNNVKDIYIGMDNRGGCCSGPVFVPVIKLGRPEDISLYETFVKDEITVYVPKKVSNEEAENITIKLRNILGFKSLVVTGILAYKEQNWKKKKY